MSLALKTELKTEVRQRRQRLGLADPKPFNLVLINRQKAREAERRAARRRAQEQEAARKRREAEYQRAREIDEAVAAAMAEIANDEPPPPRHPKIAQIVEAVSDFYGISRLDVLSGRRMKPLMLPRHVSMYLARMMTPHSLPVIGRYIGGRDHTTILNGVRKIEGLLQTDSKLAAEIEELQSIIRQRIET